MNGEQLTAFVTWAVCLGGLLILHLLVEITDIRRELRQLRRAGTLLHLKKEE